MANRHQGNRAEAGWERAEEAREKAWNRNEGADRRYARILWRKLEEGMKVTEGGIRFEYVDRRDYNYTTLSKNGTCKLLSPSDFDSFDSFRTLFVDTIHEITTHYGRWVLDGHGYAVYYSHDNELMVCGSGTTRWGVPAVLADQAFAWRLFQEALAHMDENEGELVRGWSYSLRDNVVA